MTKADSQRETRPCAAFFLRPHNWRRPEIFDQRYQVAPCLLRGMSNRERMDR